MYESLFYVFEISIKINVKVGNISKRIVEVSSYKMLTKGFIKMFNFLLDLTEFFIFHIYFFLLLIKKNTPPPGKPLSRPRIKRK